VTFNNNDIPGHTGRYFGQIFVCDPNSTVSHVFVFLVENAEYNLSAMTGGVRSEGHLDPYPACHPTPSGSRLSSTNDAAAAQLGSCTGTDTFPDTGLNGRE
jgi:hypothetical protein